MKVIEGFSRIGEENAFAVLARAEQLAAGGKDVINLGIGQPDFHTPVKRWAAWLHRRNGNFAVA